MPNLVNRLPHARGKKFVYNATEYEIGHDGVVKDVKEDDAAKLLANKQVWMAHDGKAKPLSTAPKRVALIDDQGRHFHADHSATAPGLSGAPLISDDPSKSKDVTHDHNKVGQQGSLQPLQANDPHHSKDVHHTPGHKGVPEIEASQLLGEQAAQGNKSAADVAKDEGSEAVDGADDADKDAISPRKKRR